MQVQISTLISSIIDIPPPPELGAGAAAATGAESTAGRGAFLSFLPAAISASKPPRAPPATQVPKIDNN
jgi:hypothetical protein